MCSSSRLLPIVWVGVRCAPFPSLKLEREEAYSDSIFIGAIRPQAPKSHVGIKMTFRSSLASKERRFSATS